MNRKTLVPALALLVFAACNGDGTTNPINNPTGNLRFVSAVHGNVNVIVDGTPLLTNVALGGYTAATLAAGTHSIVIQKVGGGSTTAQNVTLSGTNRALVLGLEQAGTLGASILTDTNAVVPAGATKLRVIHAAAGASGITAWRTQPDFGTMIRVQFPFPYNAVSPYMQSSVGDWRVMVSSEQNAAGSAPMPDTLAATPVIAVASGASKTVVVVDGATAGSVQMVVVEP